MLYRVHLFWAGFELTALVLIGTDCLGNCKSNYHTITTTTVRYASETLWSWHLNQIIFLIGTLIDTTWRSIFSFFFTYLFLSCWIYFWIGFCFSSSGSFSTVYLVGDHLPTIMVYLHIYTIMIFMISLRFKYNEIYNLTVIEKFTFINFMQKKMCITKL